MIGVCGVIGYAGTTSGSICRMASATAWPPVRMRASAGIVLDHLDRVDGAHLGTDLAALAVVEVEAREDGAVELHGGVGAVEPAEQAVDAQAQVDRRLDAGAPAARAGLHRACGPDD